MRTGGTLTVAEIVNVVSATMNELQGDHLCDFMQEMKTMVLKTLMEYIEARGNSSQPSSDSRPRSDPHPRSGFADPNPPVGVQASSNSSRSTFTLTSPPDCLFELSSFAMDVEMDGSFSSAGHAPLPLATPLTESDPLLTSLLKHQFPLIYCPDFKSPQQRQLIVKAIERKESVVAILAI